MESLESLDEDTFITAASQPLTHIELGVSKVLAAAAKLEKALERSDAQRFATQTVDSQGSVTQVDPGVAVSLITPRLVVAVEEMKVAKQTLIAERALKAKKALEAKKSLDAKKALKAEMKELASALAKISLQPDTRLVIAYPRDSRQYLDSNSLVPTKRRLNTKMLFSVMQRMEDVDFTLPLPPYKQSEINIVYQPLSNDCSLVLRKANTNDKADNSTYNVFIANLDKIIETRLEHSIQSAVWEALNFSQIFTIHPGVWRILVCSDEKEYSSTIDILVRNRPFNVSIHETIDATSLKRKANDYIERTRSATRLKMGTTGETIISHVASMLVADHNITQTPQKTATLLDLQDGHTAIIETQAKGEMAYSLERSHQLGMTPKAHVFCCRHSAIPKEVIAVKVLQSDAPTTVTLAEMWKREKMILENLNHENIVKLRFFDGRMLLIGLEPLPPSLNVILDDSGHKPFHLSVALKILQDISSALAYLSTKDIAHNDIKPGNISYSSQRGSVLFDFGLADSPFTPTRIIGGTPWYLPPEYIGNGFRGVAGDVWALGITMLCILGDISFPEKFDRWMITNLWDTRGYDRKRMRSWLSGIAYRREYLRNQVNRRNKGKQCTGLDKVQSLVVQMLHVEASRRVKAAELKAKAAAIKLE